MKNALILLLFVIFFSCKKESYKSINGIKNTQNLFVANYKKLNQETNTLAELAGKNTTVDELRNQFKKTRLIFKKCEEFLAFYYPTTSVKINGAPIDENEILETSRKVEYATGFQKVEEILFDENVNKKLLFENIQVLQGYVQILNNQIKELEFSDSNIFEIQKLQLFRIMSLGISGFDSSVAMHALPETQSALLGIQSYINCFLFDKTLNSSVCKAVAYIKRNKDFNSFDRAVFITDYIVPIYTTINTIQKKLGIKNNTYVGAIDFSKENPFEKGIFSLKHFAPAYNRNPSKAQIELGKELFFDTILSGDNSVSCAQCHNPKEAYADHNNAAVPNSINPRNTPTLLNVAFQNNQFLDGRVNYLEDQAKAVINNKDEMHGNLKTALSKINANAIYVKKFRKVFPNQNQITEENLLKSIASFIRTLTPINSKFDKYLRGEGKLMSNEKKGFNLFMGKAKCATCHFFPLFNGSVPPYFNKTESEVLGITTSVNSKKIDTDLGEYLITKAPLKKHAFKTPTIRNSALTFPYMHHGGFKTLEEVISFYNNGGGKGIGLTIDNQTLPDDHLNLSDQEIKDLISFIKTLNDTY